MKAHFRTMYKSINPFLENGRFDQIQEKAPYLLLVSFDSPLNDEIKAEAAKSGDDASTHSSGLIKRLSKKVETFYFKDAQKIILSKQLLHQLIN